MCLSKKLHQKKFHWKRKKKGKPRSKLEDVEVRDANSLWIRESETGRGKLIIKMVVEIQEVMAQQDL